MMMCRRRLRMLGRSLLSTLIPLIALAALAAAEPTGDEAAEKEQPAQRPVRDTILPAAAEIEHHESPAEILGRLPRFGADLFLRAVRVMDRPDEEEPAASSAPVPASYVLGPGDALSLQVFAGEWEQLTQEMTVTPEGFIFPEQLGRVTAAGQTIEQLRESLRRSYARLFAEPTVTLTISSQRSIEVYATGDVVRPGRYLLSGMATVLDALYAAGGPSEIGSYRRIRLSRVGAQPREIDLYDYLLTGERQSDVLLNPGDTIFVPPMGPEVGLAGEVRRPARYELTADATVADAIQMAGGLTPQAHRILHLWRTDERQQWRMLTCDCSGEGGGLQMALEDGDVLVARRIRDSAANTVRILGAVKRPGYYPVDRYPTVSALIEAAEGLSVDAHVGRGVISRLDSQRHFEIITFEVAKALEGDPEHDLVLQAKDYVTIYEQEEVEPPAVVEISGAVQHPGVYRWAANLRVSQLVMRAGGLTPEAYTGRADLLRVGEDQSWQVIPVNLAAALKGDEEEDIVLQRGDRLQVKTREEVGQAGTVHIEGLVHSPGDYPRHGGMRVSDLIFAAGGLTPGAGPHVELIPGHFEGDPQPVRLMLTGEGDEYQVEPDPVLSDDDSVTVTGRGEFKAQADVVFLKGRVEQPGAYPIDSEAGEEEYTVWDLLQDGGSILADANVHGIVVYRRRGAALGEAQEEDLNRVLQSVNREARQQEAMQVDTAEQARSMQQAVGYRLQQVMTTPGGVSIVLPPRPVQEEDWVAAIPIDGEALLESQGREENLALEPGDTIMVPKKVNTVMVLGAVPRSGAIPYVEGERLEYYLNESGSLREDAAGSRMVVVHANGAVEPIRRATVLRPGDVVVVPTRHIVRSVQTESDLDLWLRTIVPLATAALVF
ncbi:MAG: SLBB domain-containing protein [Armatimonadota bacterium]|nr:SLBB domain-containing protein [Armatimonadota bacterium]